MKSLLVQIINFWYQHQTVLEQLLQIKVTMHCIETAPYFNQRDYDMIMTIRT